MITRRNFLKTITTAAGLMLLDPSALIEQVGTTFYSFPPAQITLTAEELALQFKRLYGDKIVRLFSRHALIYDQFAKATQGRPKGDGYIFNLEYSK